MKKASILAPLLLAPLMAAGAPAQIHSFDLGKLNLTGSYCEFTSKNGTVLASDWREKFWMNIDGKMVEFTSTQTDAAITARLSSKRWKETLKRDGSTVVLNLAETGRGEDSAAFRGYLEVQRDGGSKRIQVTGGCGA